MQLLLANDTFFQVCLNAKYLLSGCINSLLILLV
jgi:hypothetical protein